MPPTFCTESLLFLIDVVDLSNSKLINCLGIKKTLNLGFLKHH